MGDDPPFAPPCANAWAMTCHLLRPAPACGRWPAICLVLRLRTGDDLPLFPVLHKCMGDDLPFAPACVNAWAMTRHSLCPSTSASARTCQLPRPESVHGRRPAICSILCKHMGDDSPFAPPCANTWVMTGFFLHPAPTHGKGAASLALPSANV